MDEIILIITIIAILISLTFRVEETKQKISYINVNKKFIKFLYLIQIIVIISIVLSIYSISYFIFNEGLLPINVGIIKLPEITSIVDWGLPTLIVLGIFDKILIFAIIDFLIIILKNYFNSLKNTRYLIVISKVYLIRFILSFAIIVLETGKLSLNFDSLLFYITILVFVNIFSKITEDMEMNDNNG